MSQNRQPTNQPVVRPERNPLWWSLALTVLLACFCFDPRINGNPRLLESFAGAAAGLLVFLALSWRQVSRSGRVLSMEYAPRPVHYVQFAMHSSVYLYWGWYWREVYHDVSLIAAQIVFAYALDMLVCWSRREKWILGFGPVPIVLSTNLFLWFRDDWFFLQFLLIATGILGKEFIKWRRDGRLTHIFNPSAFSLFLFSTALLATKHTDWSWGIQIATTFHRPPYIYLEIFLLGLVVQALFRVTLVTLSAAAALYVLNISYTHMTGDYQFLDSNIPVAVFLGLHLLVTDPSTSPRTSLGKIIFGSLYGIGVFGSYGILKSFGAPEFYDKLLVVPPLNLTVKLLDRFSEAVAALVRRRIPPLHWTPQRANFAWMGIWIVLFVAMTGTGFLVKGEDHPGSKPDYWAKRCEQNKAGACAAWVRVLEGACGADSGPDCFTLARLANEGKYMAKDDVKSGISLGRACDLGVSEACGGLMRFIRAGGRNVLLSACEKNDGASCFLIGSLFSSGFGVPKSPEMALELFKQSCDIGWWRACGRLGVSYLSGQGTPVNPILAIANFEKGCTGQNAASCLEAAKFYRGGKLEDRARDRMKRACELGLQTACQQEKSLAN